MHAYMVMSVIMNGVESVLAIYTSGSGQSMQLKLPIIMIMIMLMVKELIHRIRLSYIQSSKF